MKPYVILIVMLTMSCSHPESGPQMDCIPELVFEALSDTIQEGHKYEAKIYLSDTSYLYIKNRDGVFKVKPKITVDKNPLKVDENGVAKLQFDAVKIGDAPINEQKIYCEISFPHPREGDVTIGEHITYWVKEDGSQ